MYIKRHFRSFVIDVFRLFFRQNFRCLKIPVFLNLLCNMPKVRSKRSKSDVDGPDGNKQVSRVEVVDRENPPKKRKLSTSTSDSFSPSSSLPLDQQHQTTSHAVSSDCQEFIGRISVSRTNWGSAQLFPFRMERVRTFVPLKSSLSPGSSVVYWMSRDCRVQDNWALLYAQKMALQARVPLHVVFCLVSKFGGHATYRAYKFLLDGLQEVEKDCRQLNIPFHLLRGPAKLVLPAFMQTQQTGLVVCDFWPLRGPQEWIDELKPLLDGVGLQQVDAHNIAPAWEASNKEEIGARTLRSKIHKLKDKYHTAFPPVIPHPFNDRITSGSSWVDWNKVEDDLEVDRSVGPVDWAKPGTLAGYGMLHEFLQNRLAKYELRNDPNADGVSNLSPWFHFGQISVARAILEGETLVKKKPALKAAFEIFFEEAVIRRELSDNFCLYQPNYDSIQGAKPWARLSLQLHATDQRPALYDLPALEQGRTLDDLWNATQMQLVHEGKCHGFLRMYWAKKILEWTETPEIALENALYLNDKYSLDGRDPNGYVGCMWSICGTHDRGWAERSVFGKIRYMNYGGCQRKIDVPKFVEKYRAFFPLPTTTVPSY